MNRDILINFIPKPTNNQVIIYDTSLKDLINEDVLEEYKKLLPVFNLQMAQFLGYKNNIEDYKKKINEIYLYKKNWSEDDYLYYLQNEKKTYANIFNSIKRVESNIEMLKKKVKIIEEKITMQEIKEAKDIENKKKNIDNRINENVEKLLHLKEVASTLKIESEKIKESLQENQEDFEMLQKILEDIENGNCRCRYCNSKLSNVSKDSNFYKRTYKNLERNKNELNKLLDNKKKNDEQLSKYNAEIKTLREEIKNDTNFKSQNFNFYQKKSLQILKLEAEKDLMLNNILKLEKDLENNPETKSKQFLELKDKINKYEISLENLQKMKTMKESLKKDVEEYCKIEKDIKEMTLKMEQYKKFLTIFFKIYEQKANEFCGKDFKFKIFEFEDYKLIEKFEIYYKTIKYENLSIESKNKVDEILNEKFIISD